ncbi:folylpolyglutamate synthase, mitochondrial isoform X2 [Lingula anatina]|uniref:tetrahydrofolate synthase n=1 Tax=Lingula anatina TaxID=7574 RepID=A0A1S3IDZ4_LINAN|nr:folylpolyglutamate synthase, mitochondrial isoform X2 [Lingula anatina]|eukprot:XP_013395674.1 folylpolyglutamate synthase, mitochondrial isoform X2 [Lingula anatina]
MELKLEKTEESLESQSMTPWKMFQRCQSYFQAVSTQGTKICPKPTLDEAIDALNGLQSNAAVIEKKRQDREKNGPNVTHSNVPETKRLSELVGVTLDDIDKLNVIHVSGTKGKGSTCAFCESILRAHGYKTGFYSSPHLVEVRERIRLNGLPLSKDMFTDYFWQCYNKLIEGKDSDGGSMPSYFKFLTVMAFKVFVQEKVDVAVIEVGIGGQYDCTNIVRKPVVCGITSLGIDHVSILGDTIEKIAWQKAGIMKPGCPAVTVPQPGDSLQVINQRAKEIGSSLTLAPPIEKYGWSSSSLELGIAGDVQYNNASLALQLCHTWLKKMKGQQDLTKNGVIPPQPHGQSENVDGIPEANIFAVTDLYHQGLKKCSWPGRSQTLKQGRITYFLDGAHTPRSIEVCGEWFNKASSRENKENGRIVRVLLFNSTGERESRKILKPLAGCGFDCAVFCPNIVSTSGDHADLTNNMVTMEKQMLRCQQNKEAFVQLLQTASANGPSDSDEHDIEGIPRKRSKKEYNLKELDIDSDVNENLTKSYAQNELNDFANSTSAPHPFSHKATIPTYAFPTIVDTLGFVSCGEAGPIPSNVDLPEILSTASTVHVLVTGSLHLVGAMLSVLNPDLN